MVLTLVLLPAFAGVLGGKGGGTTDLAGVAERRALTIGKIAAFVAIMLIVGKRRDPLGAACMAHTGSRELFRLAVLVIALGAAFGAAELFGVSFALGAFFAGMILSESPFSQRAAEETLPLRDAFAVLFFVSVGMLFDPRSSSRIRSPCSPRSPSSCSASRLRPSPSSPVRLPASTALLVSVSLAQIGEFSFILAGLGVDLGLLPEAARPHPRRRHPLDPAQSAAVCRARYASGMARSRAEGNLRAGGGRRRPRESATPRSPIMWCWSGTAGRRRHQRRPCRKEGAAPRHRGDDERLAELKAQGIEAIAGKPRTPRSSPPPTSAPHAPARRHPRRLRGRPGG